MAGYGCPIIVCCMLAETQPPSVLRVVLSVSFLPTTAGMHVSVYEVFMKCDLWDNPHIRINENIEIIKKNVIPLTP